MIAHIWKEAVQINEKEFQTFKGHISDCVGNYAEIKSKQNKGAVSEVKTELQDWIEAWTGWSCIPQDSLLSKSRFLDP